MKVKVPAVVKLGAHPFEVKLVRGLAEKRSVLGTSWVRKGYMAVDVDQTPSQRVTTLIHEVIHSSETIFKGDSKALTEGQIGAISEGMTQFLTGALGLEFDFRDLAEVEAI